MVQGDRNIRLVDYDGMFLPQYHGERSPELGHKNYQHPQRSAEDYDDYIDNFPSLVIYLSLLAVASDRGLWEYFHNDDNLIFTGNDYAVPESSEIFKGLKDSPDPTVAKLTKYLEKCCTLPVDKVPDLETVLRDIESGTTSPPRSGPQSTPPPSTIRPTTGSGYRQILQAQQPGPTQPTTPQPDPVPTASSNSSLKKVILGVVGTVIAIIAVWLAWPNGSDTGAPGIAADYRRRPQHRSRWCAGQLESTPTVDVQQIIELTVEAMFAQTPSATPTRSYRNGNFRSNSRSVSPGAANGYPYSRSNCHTNTRSRCYADSCSTNRDSDTNSHADSRSTNRNSDTNSHADSRSTNRNSDTNSHADACAANRNTNSHSYCDADYRSANTNTDSHSDGDTDSRSTNGYADSCPADHNADSRSANRNANSRSHCYADADARSSAEFSGWADSVRVHSEWKFGYLRYECGWNRLETTHESSRVGSQPGLVS